VARRKRVDLEQAAEEQKLDRLRVEVHRLKGQLQDERSAHNRTLARVHEERDRADFALGLDRGARCPDLKIPALTGRVTREGCPLVLASDWHVAETVDPHEVNGLNSYDLRAAERRAANFADGVDWLVKWIRSPGMADRGYDIKQLALWFGGDLMTGWIHDELKTNTSLTPLQESMKAQDLAEGVIRHLLDSLGLERIWVVWQYGNHSRNTIKTHHSRTADHSYEYMIGKQIEKTFKGDERVVMQVPRGRHYYADVLDTTVRFMHGDQVRGGRGIGGIAVPIKRAVAQWNNTRLADLTVMGHFHQLNDFGDAVVNGSLIGYSPFAISHRFAYEPPQQAFCLIDRKRGKCMVTPIWVDKAVKK